jgi:hypothetical protein
VLLQRVQVARIPAKGKTSRADPGPRASTGSPHGRGMRGNGTADARTAIPARAVSGANPGTIAGHGSRRQGCDTAPIQISVKGESGDSGTVLPAGIADSGALCEPVLTPANRISSSKSSEPMKHAGLKRHVRIGRPSRDGNREEEANKCDDFGSRLHRILLSPDEYCARSLPRLFKWCGLSWEKAGNCRDSGAPRRSISARHSQSQR